MKEKIKILINEKMEEHDLEFISDKEEIVETIYERFCRNCQLKDSCELCKTVKEEVMEKIKEKVGEKNIR